MISQDRPAHIAAIRRMDDPDDWQTLLEIGADLAAHFEDDIRRWVRQYLLCLPAAAAAAGGLPPASSSTGSQTMEGHNHQTAGRRGYVLTDGPQSLMYPPAFLMPYQQRSQLPAAAADVR
jgi:hypothetical protein